MQATTTLADYECAMSQAGAAGHLVVLLERRRELDVAREPVAQREAGACSCKHKHKHYVRTGGAAVVKAHLLFSPCIWVASCESDLSRSECTDTLSQSATPTRPPARAF